MTLELLTFANYLCLHPELRDRWKGSQPPWIDTTNGRIGDIMMFPERIPSSWSAAEAAKFEAGGESFVPVSHPQQKLRRGLPSMYQYSPLTNEFDQIRFLHLLPGQRDDPIRIRLEPCSLSNPPSYEAVSYAWGSKSDTAVVIICESEVDYTVEVPQSLHGALKQLRHYSEDRRIWADAICINQTDNKEKNLQVRLMRKIYQRATRVVIWLGDGDEIGCEANSLFESIGQMNKLDFMAMPRPETWTALGRFYKSPWFWRIWCLQEAILAPAAQVMLGEHSRSWEHIGFAATWIRDTPAETFQYDNSALIGVHNACLIYGMSRTNAGRQRLSFLQLLALTRPFIATDFRDKIYGILGIPTTDSDPDTDEPFLQPDYTKTLSEVYIECALAIIRKTRSLRILSYVQHGLLPRRISDISEKIKADDTLIQVPSWVPRWHQYFARTLAPQELEMKTFKTSASISTDLVSRTNVRGLELNTYGARIARVKSVSRIFDSSMTLPHISPETTNEVWIEAFDALKASITDPTEVLYALSTLLTAGKDWFGGIIENREQHFADFLAFMYNPAMFSDGGIEVGLDHAQGGSTRAKWRDGPQRRHPNLLLDSLFRPRTDLALPPVAEQGQAHCFREAMRGACTWRRLLVTDDGHVGLGPQVTEPGDVVCILQDAIMPLVLRPETDGDKFKLVGEAYIQGMMFGEIHIYDVEQIVLSDKPFVSLDEIEECMQVDENAKSCERDLGDHPLMVAASNPYI